MSKETEVAKGNTANIPTTRTPNICTDFSANPGDIVSRQGAPNGCQVSQSGSSTWPFSVASPITLPSPSQVTIKMNLRPGPYPYNVSCCTSAANKSVNVNS